VAIAEHLHFHVARPLHQPLEVHLAAREAPLGHRCRALHHAQQLVGRSRGQHADAAASGGRLDEDRIADLPRPPSARRRVPSQHAGAAADRPAVARGQIAGARLVSHRVDPARRRSDEADARRSTRVAKPAFSERNP
jgi:hypothetical protein